MSKLREACRLALLTLREIFDENAYQRFLSRHGVEPSKRAYRDFVEEQRRSRERRVKCC